MAERLAHVYDNSLRARSCYKLRRKTDYKRGFLRCVRNPRTPGLYQRLRVYYNLMRSSQAFHSHMTHCNYPPAFLAVEVTNRCNLSCIMCPRGEMGRPQGDMSLSLFRKIVDKARGFPLRAMYVQLFGEPLLNPDLFEMIRYAKEAGIYEVVMNTNATLLDKASASRVIESGLDRMVLSFEGGSKETYERIRRNARYDPTLRNILDFLEMKKASGSRKPFTILQTIRMKPTEKEIDLFLEKFKGLPVDKFFVGDFDNWANQVETINTLQPDQNPLRQEFPCADPWRGMVVCWDGRVIPCCRDFDAKYTLGNLNDQTLLQVWNSVRMMRLRDAHTSSIRGIDPCQSCNQTTFVDSPTGILFTALRRWIGLA